MRASRSAAAVLAVTAVLACSGCSAATSASPAAKPTAHAASAATSVKRALASCGLSPTTPGVTVGDRVLLGFVTDRGGRPTGIDRLDATCALDALGLPSTDRALLQSTSITGGFQTVAWSGFTSTWRFRDTLTFDIEVYSAG
ncbi:hypothetical protein AX769_18165 [Frondihabitans sp. PAMC 28766]|uniref:hypothetical protein n=1 Tax=Frondihabitans sp. PAMC 28766 TaxID=1795630 RepID=UPI00078E0FAE|nr:hypothetical protein [Frondihabitans sp. PAMC 28766]AMM21723.1 hypothetical protein AX769_18165 [Frondihabitans sp. PAMC 28766]